MHIKYLAQSMCIKNDTFKTYSENSVLAINNIIFHIGD